MNRVISQQPPWQRCPYLGLHDDSSTSLAYASPWNFCYRTERPGPVLVSYQASVCLRRNFSDCGVYQSATWARLPPHLRGKVKVAKRTNPVPGWVFRLLELILLAGILALIVLYAQRVLP